MSNALTLSDISKSFDGFAALSDAQFELRTGEVHALLGENGAGKSTLMNVVAGLYQPDAGVLEVFGRPAAIANPRAAQVLGIGMVHQHFKLIRAFDAVENALLARRNTGYRAGLADTAQAIRKYCDQLGFGMRLDEPVGNLSIAEQQRVEILKVLLQGCRILILDEPTAVLTDEEGERLLQTVRKLADDGVAVVLVTHKLGEVRRHADRVTIMRGGRTIETVDPRGLSPQHLTRMVVGADIDEKSVPSRNIGAPQISIRDLSVIRADGYAVLNGLGLAVRSGEIYGIAGVGGNGQTEFFETLAGVRTATSGGIEIQGSGDVTGLGPLGRRRLGLASIPADRQKYALAGELSVADNCAAAAIAMGGFASMFSIRRRAIDESARQAVGEYEIHGVRDVGQPASLLSGGNAQKLVIARELGLKPRIVLVHSPSRGLDVRATAEVHNRLRHARDAGAAILLISEDLDEVITMSDRIGVMNRGAIAGEFSRPYDRTAIGALMVHHA